MIEDQAVGCSERQLSQEMDELLCGLSPDESLALHRRLRERSLELGLWTEENAQKRPISLAPRPWLVDPESLLYLQQASWQLRLALRALPQLLRSLPELQRLVPLEESEKGWLSRAGGQDSGPGERLYCRLDAVGDLTPGGLKFVETNVVGIGGMTYAPAATAALGEYWGELYSLPDPRLLLLEEMHDYGRALGLKRPPRVALVDDQNLYRLGGEMGRLEGFLRERGLEARAVDVRRLEECDGEMLAEGEPVDLVYRFLELKELSELDAREPLHWLKAAFREGRIIPSLAGDLDHKSVFEIFTTPGYRKFFQNPQLEVFHRHLPWTRLLFERRTCSPEGDTVDLFEFVAGNRDRLVMKPNRGYGGTGVHLGMCTSEGIWRDALEQASYHPCEMVVQDLAAPLQARLPLFDTESRIERHPCYLSWGFFPSRRGMAALGRYAGGPVVNLCQNGGVIPLMKVAP